jgi:hypothetical protein
MITSSDALVSASRLSAALLAFALSIWAFGARAQDASSSGTPTTTPSAPVASASPTPPPTNPPPDQSTDTLVPDVHQGFVYRSITMAKYNPLGLSTWERIGYTKPLYAGTQNILLQGSYVGAHVVGTGTPAYGRIGGRVDVQPLSILQLFAACEFVGFFGTFDSIASFPNVAGDFSNKHQSALGTAGLTYPTTEMVVTLEPVLQARVGPIIFYSDTNFIYLDIALRPGDQTYYDLTLSVLAPRRGWVVTNDTNLNWATKFGMQIGVRGSVVYSAFTSDQIGPGNNERAGEVTPVFSLGPTLTYVFSSHNTHFIEPTVFMVAQWWLRDPYRSGQETSEGLPYLDAGFSFRGEL